MPAYNQGYDSMSEDRQLFRCIKDGRYITCSLPWSDPLNFIEHWARIKPSHQAIISYLNHNKQRITISWAKLLRDCLTIAQAIKNSSVERFAIISGSHITTIQSVLAILLAGREFTIVDLLNTPDELQSFKLENSSSSALIIPALEETPDLLIDKIINLRNRFSNIQIFSTGTNKLADANLINNTKSKRITCLDYHANMWSKPSCLIYSPGHYHQPTGFFYKTSAIYANMLAVAERFKFTPQTRFLLAGEIDTCCGLIPTLATLLAGGTVILSDNITSNNFWNIVRESNASLARLAPALIEALVRSPSSSQWPGHGHLKYVIASGDYLPRQISMRFYEMFDIPIIQCYGTAETGGYVLGMEPGLCNRLYEISLRDNIVGQEFSFCNVKLVRNETVESAFSDNHQGGIIHIRGHTVSVGYWANGEIKYWNKPWLETSDLGCKVDISEKQYFQIKGRVEDALILDDKIIWPMGIEQSLLTTFPFLSDCIATTVTDGDGKNTLSVVVVISPDMPDNRRSELLALMQARIDAGGVVGINEDLFPKYLIMIDENKLPRRYDGRVDRKKLQAQISKQSQGLAI